VGLAVFGSTGNKQSTGLHVARAVAAGAPVSQKTSSSSQQVPTVQVSRGVLTPAVRDMKPARGHWNTMFNKATERSRGESTVIQDRHQGSALVQRSAPRNQMPSPMANFEGVGANGAVPPDTEGDIGAGDYYMQWVNLQFRIFHRDGTPATAATPGYQLFTGQSVCGSPSGNGGDPIALYDQFSNRWIAAHLAYPNRPPHGPL